MIEKARTNKKAQSKKPAMTQANKGELNQQELDKVIGGASDFILTKHMDQPSPSY